MSFPLGFVVVNTRVISALASQTHCVCSQSRVWLPNIDIGDMPQYLIRQLRYYSGQGWSQKTTELQMIRMFAHQTQKIAPDKQLYYMPLEYTQEELTCEQVNIYNSKCHSHANAQYKVGSSFTSMKAILLRQKNSVLSIPVRNVE